MVLWHSIDFVVIFSVAIFAHAEHLRLELGTGHRISVAVSERNPFVVFDQNGGQSIGLDVSIVKNFAKKFGFEIDYTVLNASLNYIFANKENLKTFPVETITR